MEHKKNGRERHMKKTDGSGRGAGAARGLRGSWSAAAEARFLQALAETGNVGTAAAAAKITAASAYGRRKAKAEFAQGWAEALERRKAEGRQRVVRRTRWGMQRVRCRRQWTERAEERFLDQLAASCNVETSCQEAGVSHTTVYRHRRKRPEFAAKWQEALEQGYARLEMVALEGAIAALQGAGPDASRPIAGMSAETAIRLLTLHRAAVTGVGKKSGWQRPRRSIEEAQASILAKLEAIEALRAAGKLP